MLRSGFRPTSSHILLSCGLYVPRDAAQARNHLWVQNLRWCWCFSWWFVQDLKELVIKNRIKPKSFKYQPMSLTDPSFHYISYSCCLFSVTVTTSVLSCLLTLQDALTEPGPSLILCYPSEVKHLLVENFMFHHCTQLCFLEPPGNVFIVSGDVDFAQGTVLPTKGRWGRIQVPLTWENLCGFISERVQPKTVSIIMTVEPHCHLSASRYTFSWATSFLFFPTPNLSFQIIEILLPANTAWGNIGRETSQISTKTVPYHCFYY